MPKLSPNQTAPSFTALDQNGQTQTLKKYLGSWVLLYFYPKDDTPGCTTEACSFRDIYSELKQKMILLGVSGDTQASHQKFAQKFQLPFPLLVDDDKKIVKAYGADGLVFPRRVTFLIDPKGLIYKIYEKVDVNGHAQQILADLPS